LITLRDTALAEPIPPGHRRFDALAASTAEHLGARLDFQPPTWLSGIAACDGPWFVSGLESLKAIAIVESPAPFRMRNIFVLENFLDRA